MAVNFVWDSTFKRLTALLSAGAALASILSFAIGRETADGLGLPDVDRLEVLPAMDTAYALGDTIRLTAMAADRRGVAMVPRRIQWQTDDSMVAVVDSGGRVLVRGPGKATVSVAAGSRMALAHVWVTPRVTELFMPGDSVIQVAEGKSLELRALARDARGHRVPGASVRLTVADEAVATIDTNGVLRALTPGSTVLSATFSDLLIQRRLEVKAVPMSLTLSKGGAQRAPVGDRLPIPLTVQVVSRSGRPVPQVPVRFEAVGGGSMELDTALTDSAGVVRSRWTLGPRPGRQRALVNVGGIDTPLEVTAEADPLASRTRVTVSPDTLTAGVMETLAQPVVVQLTDTSGAVLADVPVTWRTLDGGEVVAVSARSDSSGQVQGRWTLGAKAGRQRLSIQIGNPSFVAPRIVTAWARPAAPSRLEVVSGNDQKGTVGKPLPKEVALRVTDSVGNPVGDVPVRIRRTGQQGEDSVIRSDKDGRVRFRWTLSRTAGIDGFTAELPEGEDDVRLTAIGRPGAADSIHFLGAPTTAVAGRAIGKLEVKVTDRYGNPVPGVSVKFSATTGSLSSARGVTGTDGLAQTRWTPGAKLGPQSVTAIVAGGTPRARHSIQVDGAAAKKKGTTTRPKSAAKSKGRSAPSSET